MRSSVFLELFLLFAGDVCSLLVFLEELVVVLFEGVVTLFDELYVRW